jgi:hypothetical protein
VKEEINMDKAEKLRENLAKVLKEFDPELTESETQLLVIELSVHVQLELNQDREQFKRKVEHHEFLCNMAAREQEQGLY